jgi:hypothetical protein
MDDILNNLYNIPVQNYVSALESQIRKIEGTVKSMEGVPSMSIEIGESFVPGFDIVEYYEYMSSYAERVIDLRARLEVLQEATDQVIDEETNNLIAKLGQLKLTEYRINEQILPSTFLNQGTARPRPRLVRDKITETRERILERLAIVYN